jgi:D-sedoheptulose 7-phosphate isomerase
VPDDHDVRNVLSEHLDAHRQAADGLDQLLPLVSDAARRICQAFESGGRVYTFGNGGSAADAQHLAGELIGRYRRTRRPLPAIALSSDPSVVTCIANDFGYEELFSRQVTALARDGDVVIGFSTGGQSVNVTGGLAAARANGATTILFTGGDGGPARAEGDIALVVPSDMTARVQEMHVLLLHLLSEAVDDWAAATEPASTAISGAP